MMAYNLALTLLGVRVAQGFITPTVHMASTLSPMALQTRMTALDFSATPVNTAETLQRTSTLAIEGAGKKKLALLGSTVREWSST